MIVEFSKDELTVIMNALDDSENLHLADANIGRSFNDEGEEKFQLEMAHDRRAIKNKIRDYLVKEPQWRLNRFR